MEEKAVSRYSADSGAVMERVVVGGDLSQLRPADRVRYYNEVCKSLGLNPLTRPFAYITLNGKLTLYAQRDCTDQLRRLHSISIDKPEIRFEDDWIIVTVAARNGDGRTDSDVGVVNKKDMRGDFGNALMKAITKAKRRVTLSIVGLGWLDETEVETIPGARPAEQPVVAAIEAPAAVEPEGIEPSGYPPEIFERWMRRIDASPDAASRAELKRDFAKFEKHFSPEQAAEFKRAFNLALASEKA